MVNINSFNINPVKCIKFVRLVGRSDNEKMLFIFVLKTVFSIFITFESIPEFFNVKNIFYDN